MSSPPTYPPRFRRPIPLSEWKSYKGFSNAKTAKYFSNSENDFRPVTIQKMLANPDRDIGVWEDKTLVETKELDAVSVFVGGENLGEQKILYIQELKPRPNLGPSPNALKRGPRPSVNS